MDLTAVLAAELRDPAGRTMHLRDCLAGGTAVLVFLRHFA